MNFPSSKILLFKLQRVSENKQLILIATWIYGFSECDRDMIVYS